MVLKSGMSDSDLTAYQNQICANHRMRIVAQIWDLNHNPLIDVSKLFEDGQTNIDSTQPISRSATLSLFDPTRSVGFDSSNPSDSTVSPKYMLHKRRGVFVESLAKWIDIPVFTGPITTPTRDGDLLSITANGKEQLALNKAWNTLTVKKGTDKGTAIRTIMSALGEQFFRISDTTALAPLGADVAVTKDDTHWDIAKGIATGLGWLMFYDAEGYLVVRPQSTTPVFEFKTGNGGSIRSAWQIGYSSDGVYNLVYATGSTPSGKTVPLSAFSVAAAGTPLDPVNLGRGGQPLYLRYDTSDDTLTKQADVQALADRTLPQVLLDSVTISFESLPIAHLEEADAVNVTDVDTGVQTPTTMRTWTIPDSSAGTQSNGFLRKVSRSPRILRKTIA